MWRITLDTDNPALRGAVEELAKEHGAVARVEDFAKRGADQVAKLASELWLIEKVCAKLEQNYELVSFEVSEVRECLQTCGLTVLAQMLDLTLEELLTHLGWLAPEVLEIMAEVGLTLADGADPALFAQEKFQKSQPTPATAGPLRAAGIDSWNMFRYLSAGFLLSLPKIHQTRLDGIRPHLRERGIALKGEV